MRIIMKICITAAVIDWIAAIIFLFIGETESKALTITIYIGAVLIALMLAYTACLGFYYLWVEVE